MKQNKLTQYLKKLKGILAPMSWSDRLEYLWTYYKEVLAGLLACILVIYLVINALTARDPAFMGISVNVTLTDEAQQYVTTGWHEKLQADKRDEAQFYTGAFGDFSQTGDQKEMTEALRITAMVAAQELDVVLMDEHAMRYFFAQGMFTDLRELLTPEQLAQLEGRIYYLEEEGIRYPMTIDITDTAFVQKGVNMPPEKVFIGFPGNTDRAALSDEFFDYLLNYQ